MMENLSKFTKDGQEFAERLFEATFIHELAHAGDQQDGEDANQQPLQFENIGGKYMPYKEIGRFIENQIYGRSIMKSDNNEINTFLINAIYSLPPTKGGGDDKKDKPAKKDEPAPPRA
jgi:hypothetical protein